MKYPKPQDYLNKEANTIYKELCKHLDSVDALEDVDTYSLSQAAFWLWLFHDSAEAVKENGGRQITSNGYSQVTAEITIMDKASARFEKLSGKLGLSPKDRELMLKFKGHKVVEDAFDTI